MEPGQDTIHECPYCKARARKGNLWCRLSFTTQVWSDGYKVEPVPWEDVRVTRCPRCHGIYWLEDARVLGKVPETTYAEVEVKVKRGWWSGMRTETQQVARTSPLSELPKLKSPDVAGLYEALADLRPDHDRERQAYLRTQLWWAYDHRFRHGRMVEPPTESDIAMNHRNLSQLLTLYQPNDEPTRLKLAGILLCLGRFGDAKAIAELMDHYKWVPYRAKFIAAAEQKRSEVFRLR